MPKDTRGSGRMRLRRYLEVLCRKPPIFPNEKQIPTTMMDENECCRKYLTQKKKPLENIMIWMPLEKSSIQNYKD